jgi:hypothetical protein
MVLSGCTQVDLVSRHDSLLGIEPFNVENDLYPPKLHSGEFFAPERLEGLINTAGAEDSPFITVDSNEFYFFFTPNASIPAEGQVGDGVTGIYVSRRDRDRWAEPERVILQSGNKLSLDGCEFVLDDKIWFCSAREGYTGLHWFTAKKSGDRYKGWKLEEFPEEYKVGELHIHDNVIYFHSDIKGSLGGNDIWSLELVNGKWDNLKNISAVNSSLEESLPYITSDGMEMYFTRVYQGSPAVFRSKKINDNWLSPELIVSQFAGEPTMDSEGNLYFVHHYVVNGQIQEADIYIARKK